MEDYKILVDSKLPILKSLHELICLFVPCVIDSEFLLKSYFVSVKAVYEEEEFRLILSVVNKPIRSDELKWILFNTKVLVQISNFILSLLVSTNPIYSLLRFVAIVITSGFIFISKLFFSTCSSFAFILRTEGKRPLLLLRMHRKMNLDFSLPSLRSMKLFWIYTSEPYIECGLSIICDSFQVVGRDIKLCLKTQPYFLSNDDTIIATMRDGSGENYEHNHLGKNKKKKKKKCSSSEPSHYFTIQGKTLDIELKETNLSSIYLKLKYFVEIYGSNLKGYDKKGHKALTFIAADFSELRLYNYKEEKPLGVAIEVFMLYSSFESWEGPVTPQSCDLSVSRLDVFAGSDNDDDKDRVSLSDLSLVYASVDEVSPTKNKTCPSNDICGDTGCINLRCRSVEAAITSEYLDLVLRSVKILRYVSFLFEILYHKLLRNLRVAVSIPHLSIKIVHMCITASNITNIEKSCHSVYGDTRNNSKSTTCDDDTDVESRSSNCERDTVSSDVEDDLKVVNNSSDPHITYFVSILVFSNCCFENNRGTIVSIGGQIDHYFGEDFFSDILCMIPYTDSISMEEHQTLRCPD